jgi:hypothetical protein
MNRAVGGGEGCVDVFLPLAEHGTSRLFSDLIAMRRPASMSSALLDLIEREGSPK